jgi:hypothetical protein
LDCLGNGEFAYTVNLSNVSGGEFQVWAGQGDCSPDEVRQRTENRQCWLVFHDTDLRPTSTKEIRVQDIASRDIETGGQVNGSVEDCNEEEFGSTAESNVILHFMIVENASSQRLISTVAKVTVQVDLKGPPPPTKVTAGIGEERIVLSWESPAATDRTGHNFYCAPVGGDAAAIGDATTMQADVGPIPDASDAAGGTGGDDGGLPDSEPPDGAGGVGAAGGAGGLAGAGGAGGVGGDPDAAGMTDGGVEAGGGGNPNCPTSALISGQRPNPALKCGESGTGDAQGEAAPLVNGQLYAVAIAGHDRLGNSGPLSAVQCATPQQVDDFYEVYKRAGGRGGGGFCSLGAQPAYGAGVLLGMAALARWMRRRRRR